MASIAPNTQNGHPDINGNGIQSSGLDGLVQKHQHDPHNPTVEEVPDEEDLKHSKPPVSSSVLEAPEDATVPDWNPPMSAKAAGKRKEEQPLRESKPLLDTQSEELFPVLGGAAKPQPATAASSLWGKKPAINGTNGFSTNGTSTPTSGINTPTSTATKVGLPKAIKAIPGQDHRQEYSLEKSQMLSRAQLKKPLPEILKDMNRKAKKTNVTFTTTETGTKFVATGPSEVAARRALIDVLAEVGSKITHKISVPQSARAHIIGKQGSKIKELQERTGVKIQVPKSEGPVRPADEDEDAMIDIFLEGTAIAVANAQQEIDTIARERTVPVTTKLRTIPAELYPFIAVNEQVNALEESNKVQIRVPPYHQWRTQPPPQKPLAGKLPVFLPAADDNHITIAGDRSSVQAAKTQIERIADELQREVTVESFPVNRGRHQFIIGNRGIQPEDFFADTGCAIILPGDEGNDYVTIVGPPSRTQQARNKATGLASSMQTENFDISRLHRNAPGASGSHAGNLTQYLRQRKVIADLEKLHRAHIVTSINHEGVVAPWELYARDYDPLINAREEIQNIVMAHPPSRVATMAVDPFYHAYLQNDITPRVKKEYGVHVVVPDASTPNIPVLLVFEGESGINPDYQVPRGQPSPEEIKAFQQGLQDAQRHILEIITAQAQITSESIDVPKLFHDKLRKYIKTEQQDRASDQIPVRVSAAGTVVTLRGPAPAVKSLAAKVNAFVAQAKEDEKERGFTLSFDFPQKHANQLIGKGGSNIRDLREKFDVEIKVDDGKVELKGPKAKAEAAKSHISALGRQWADEATYVLKIEPKYHRELIGAQGNQINKLQTRYKVQIHFPRSARPVKDEQSATDAASEAGRKNRREQEPDEVIVKGPKKGADEAKDEILSLLQYLKDTSFTASVSVQQGQIPSLIGQRGSGMDELRQLTGAKIDVPNARDSIDPSGKVEIQIKGTKSQVAQAKKILEEKKNVFDHTVTKSLEVDKKHHRSLIGPGGSTLRDIVVKAGGSDDRREMARTIQFPKAESEGNLIKIEGNQEVVEKIVAAMQQIIAELDSRTTQIVEIPTDKHRSLIGRGGETKKDLESKFKVSIDIPRQGSGQSAVEIVGLPANVEKAKIRILDLVKDQEGETIQVPRKIHHTIADNGQFFRKLRNDHQVTVDHAGHKLPPKPMAPTNPRANGTLSLITDDPSEASESWKVISTADSDIDGEIPWILRGSADSLPKAKAALLAAIEQASKNTHVGYLVLPDPRTYRYVIGQGGSNVNSIRKTTGCKITVPRDQAKDEAIEIIGSEKGIEEARHLVLKAVKDGVEANGGRT